MDLSLGGWGVFRDHNLGLSLNILYLWCCCLFWGWTNLLRYPCHGLPQLPSQQNTWAPYGLQYGAHVVFANRFHMGLMWETDMGVGDMWDLHRTYIGPLLYSCKSDGHQNNIPVINMGTIIIIGTKWFLETGSKWSPVWSPKHDRRSNHPVPKISLISQKCTS